MSINTSLLKQISETPGAPGYEKKIRDLVISEIAAVVDHYSIDNLGNLIAVKKGKSDAKPVMAAAHLDEIGFMVNYIDEDGFVFFNTLGGFDPKTLTAQRVVIHGKKDVVGVMSSKPIHVMTQEERNKVPKLSDYFIDLGMPYEEVVKWIEIGNPITREREMIEMGDCVNGKSIDNRVAVYILVECLKNLKNQEIPYDFYAVFTVQEEVGIRGANVASHQINPFFGIAIDTTIAYDVPGARAQEMVTKLGKGTAIKVMDASAICDYRMVEFMKQTAKENEIPFQLEILTAGGTDTAGVQRMGKNGAIAGAISIPTRHLHQVVEMAHKTDIARSISLLQACVSNLDKYLWDH
ncbi:M20/M25/M40 family metallo-hydrolase [bacterium]|nr:M20/M25/M40 family metallo-hydrolase [bacterium]